MQDVQVVIPKTDRASLLAVNLRDKREAANLSVKEAARRAGMHWRFWEKIEKEEGRVRSYMLRRIAHALRVEPAALFEELPEVRAAAQGSNGPVGPAVPAVPSHREHVHLPRWKPATSAWRTKHPPSPALLAEWLYRVMAIAVMASVLERWLAMIEERKRRD